MGVTSSQLHASLEGDYGNFIISKVDDITIRWTHKNPNLESWTLKFAVLCPTEKTYSFSYLNVQPDCPYLDYYAMNNDYRDPSGNRVARCEIHWEWNVDSLSPKEVRWQVYEAKISGVLKPLRILSLQHPPVIGRYETYTQHWGNYFSPLVVRSDGSITIRGGDPLSYTFDSSSKNPQLSIPAQTWSPSITHPRDSSELHGKFWGAELTFFRYPSDRIQFGNSIRGSVRPLPGDDFVPMTGDYLFLEPLRTTIPCRY